MTYDVRIWIQDGKVMCCSGVCTELSCPRTDTCKSVTIEVEE